MQELDDSSLLREYVERNSEEAFAALVTRHVNKVYSVALRHTGNPHQAEEITQAVFVVLARKSHSLGRRVILSGWLYQTARLTALTFIRGEIRRARREQEAYMQTIGNESENDTAWRQIAPLLDAAMSGLSEADRHAVVLRFFDGKSMRDVGVAMGTGEDAAKMRVSRAVEKLRRIFTKRGVVLSSAVITGAIIANSVQAAPATLAKTATTAALAKGAATSGSTLALAKTTLIIMKTKAIIAAITAVVLIMLGTGGYLFYQAQMAHASASPNDKVPIVFANDAFHGRPDSRFLNEVDADIRRTPDSAPAGHIKCLATPTMSGSAAYLASLNGAGDGMQASRGAHYEVTRKSALYGKRVRISGWVKTSNVQNWAGLALLITNAKGHIFADDEMTDRPIQGTTDWQQLEIITDVPAEPCLIDFGIALYGVGELWTDDFQIDVVSADTPITDDRRWHSWSPNPGDYSVSTNYDEMHDGHPSLYVAYMPTGRAPKGSWMWWGQDIRTPEQYEGHTVRMSGWIKTENVSGHIHPNLRPKGPNFKLLARDTMVNSDAIKGTLDWTQYSLTCDIPKGTQCLDTGFAFTGSGKVWIDMASLKYEIVK